MILLNAHRMWQGYSGRQGAGGRRADGEERRAAVACWDLQEDYKPVQADMWRLTY